MVKTDGSIDTMVLDMVPILRDARDDAKLRAGSCIRHCFNILRGLHIKVACFCRDKGSNPTEADIGVPLRTISSIVHDLNGLLKDLHLLGIIKIGNDRRNAAGVDLSLVDTRNLKREFCEEKLNDDEQKSSIREFWATLDRPKFQFPFTAFYELCKRGYFANMRNLFMRLDWGDINEDLMIQWELFLEFLVNLESVFLLIHTPMCQQVANDMTAMSNYLENVIMRAADGATIHVVRCLRFFIHAYRSSNTAFISVFLSIFIIYQLKGFIIMILCSDRMPSLQCYVDRLGEFHVNGSATLIQGISKEYGAAMINCVRVMPQLQGVFLHREILPVFNFCALNVNRAMMLRGFEDLQNANINDIAQALVFADRAVNSCYLLPPDIADEILALLAPICRLLHQKYVRRHT